MTVFTAQRDIEVPPERVWPVLADVGRWHEWTRSIERIVPLDGAALAVGARYRVHQPKLQPAEFVVTACEPPRAFTWVTTRPGLRAIAVHDLEATRGGCALRLRLEYRGWLAGLVAGLAAGLTREYLELEAAGLKRRCEPAS